MFKKLLLFIAFCSINMLNYAQITEGSTRGPSYAYRTSGENGIVSFQMNTFTPTMLYSFIVFRSVEQPKTTRNTQA